MTCRALCQKRMITARVFVSAPVLVPAGMDRPGLVLDLKISKALLGDFSSPNAPDHNAVEISNRIQIEAREISPARVSMKRAVEIRPRICNHLDLSDVKLCARGVTTARVLACEIVADHGCRQTFVSDHPMFNRVRNIHQLHN